MDRKRVLWLTSWYPDKAQPFNGDFIQRHARAASLVNDIYVIHVAKDQSIKGVKHEIASNEGLTEHRVYFKPSRILLAGRLLNAVKWLRLYKKTVKDYINQFGKPAIVHLHIPFKAGLIAIWIKRRYGIPFIVTEHWGIYNEIVEGRFSGQPAYVKRIIKKVFEAASVFHSVSRFLAEGVNNYVTGRPFTLIPNTVDTSLFYYRHDVENKFRFIHVSGMIHLKNPEGILQAAKILVADGMNVEFIFVGDAAGHLSSYAGKPELASVVHFKGEIPYEDVAEEMRKSNALILFSEMENSPCVIAEALCCGLPVLSSAVGGVPELVDESNSILVNPGDVRQLAGAMKKMIMEYDRYDRSAIAQKARAEFSFHSVGLQFDKMYKTMGINPGAYSQG